MESDQSEPRPAARRRFLIDRRLQLKYTAWMVAIAAGLSAGFGVLMYRAHLEATALADLPDPLRPTVVTHDGRLLGVLVAIAVLMAVAIAIVGILLTHRVAGPLHLLSGYVETLGRGRHPQLRPLRRHDELRGLYGVFHEAVEALRARDRARLKELAQLAEGLEALSDRSPEAAESARSVRQLEARLRQANLDPPA